MLFQRVKMFYLILIGVFICLVIFMQRKPAKFPPGPPRIPIIGSLPFLGEYKTTFARVNGLTEKFGSICGFYAGGRPVVILGDLESIKQVYKLEEASLRVYNAIGNLRYGDGQLSVKGLLFSSGTIHKEQRRFALRNLRDFGFGKSSMEEMIQNEASKLCRSIEKELDRPTQLDSKLNISILNALWTILVGEELDMENPEDLKVVNALNDFVRTGGFGGHILLQAFPFILKLFPANFFVPEKVKTGLDLIKNLCRPYREDHQQTVDTDNPRDFLDVYIAARAAAGTNSSFHGVAGSQNEEINLLDMFIAGAETTSTTITWGILYMLHHPEIMDRLHQELDDVVGRDRLPSLEDEPQMPLMSATLHEIHRSAAIVYFGVPHSNSVDIDVGGYTIPKGSTIMANIMQVMQNKDVFDNPDLFNPDRFLDGEGRFRSSPHVIPFLVGKRFCLGSSLAEKELFLFFSQLLHTFSFKPIPGQKIPSYSTKLRDESTPNGIIRFCPQYNLIISKRQ